MNKEDLLKKAYQELNKSDYPFEVAIDNDTIVASWKWKDGTFFDVGSVTREIQEFKYIVELLDDKTYIENDSSFSVNSNGNVINQNGSVNMQGFSGKQWNKHVEYTFGKDKNTGKFGIQKYSFDTNIIHKPIRDFLEQNGYCKAKQKLFEVKKTSINNLDKNLVKVLGYMFTFIGGSMTIINIIIFFSLDVTFTVYFAFITLFMFLIGIILLINTKKRK